VFAKRVLVLALVVGGLAGCKVPADSPGGQPQPAVRASVATSSSAPAASPSAASTTPVPAATPTRTEAAADGGGNGGTTGGTTGGCAADEYRNVDGDCVHRPVDAPGAPPGATAECKDGTYSFSQHRSGTCSHHGGVRRWL
jgi:hypothetical protein